MKKSFVALTLFICLTGILDSLPVAWSQAGGISIEPHPNLKIGPTAGCRSISEERQIVSSNRGH